MVRAPADWRSILRRAEVLVRRRDIRSLELLLPALRWRQVTARNRALGLFARLGPIAVPPLLVALDTAKTATERSGAVDALGRIGDSRVVSRLVHPLEGPAMTVRRASSRAVVPPEGDGARPESPPRPAGTSTGAPVIAANA